MKVALAPGQRVVSDAEPELGLGIVVALDARMVHVAFPAAEEARRYVASSSPLRRVRFEAGDSVTNDRGATVRILAVEEQGQTLLYRTSAGDLPEARVAARTSVASPRERLLAGRTDALRAFDLRRETHERLHAIRSSPVRGLVGPRIELLPHQFFVASQVAARPAPRVLLADETGLGKTIEAGLVLSRLILAGRASRVLVLVPDALLHQWLVELRRRFQLRFALYDEKRCKAAEGEEGEANPFASDQFVLAPVSLFAASPARTAQASEAGWDVVVVDEAHHLEWSRAGASPAYTAVETISRSAPGLLLLTATPEQLGAEGHFARLRLLDPDRYGDFDAWSAEASGFRDTARLARILLQDDSPLPEATSAELGVRLGLEAGEVQRRAADADGRSRLLDELIDRHGPGRVMFRNVRAAVLGLPSRRVHRIVLDPAAGELRTGDADRDLRAARRLALVQQELAADLAGDPALREAFVPDLAGDPRVEWLAGLLGPDGPRKVLAICSTRAKAEALEAALATRLRVATALFHEGLTMIQRDRNAAWFAEPEGARLMICSELGSEGRNFQHAQHLVLFDVPLDPDLVEQRIGRLDRIGQRGTVEIHVPFVGGSGFETLVRWLDEGVGALERPSLVAHPLLERFGDRLRELALAGPEADAGDVAALVADTAAACTEFVERVEKDRDLLLEAASLRRDEAARLIDEVRARDGDADFEDYFLRVLEHHHVYSEEVGPRAFLLNPDGIGSPELPSLDKDETVLAFDRAVALVREDYAFATSDHPLLGDAMELLLSSQDGNACFAILEDKAPARLWLEAVHVLETVAPPGLHVDRFLAPEPLRVVVDQHLREAGDEDDPAGEALADGRGEWLAASRASLGPHVERMLAEIERIAADRAGERIAAACRTVAVELGAERERLVALAAVNPAVRPDEIDAVDAQREALDQAVRDARLRLDALRLVWQGPARDGTPVLGKAKA